MPDLDGFGVLERLDGESRPLVVFVTAFDDHALRAFEVHAVDYVLKPFDDSRILSALDRVARQVREGELAARAGRLEGLMHDLGQPLSQQRIAVRSAGRTVFVHCDEIDWIEADGSYVQLHCGEEQLLLRQTMNALEARLSPWFVKIHRSTLVSLERIRELRHSRSGEQAILHSGIELRVSPRHLPALRRALGL